MSRATVTLRVDLVNRASDELEFLEAVDRIPPLSNGAVLQNAIRRYEQCWLPLAASTDLGFNKIAPPIDVHWVWHCHMLSPYDYEMDCQHLVGKVIDHTVVRYSELARWRSRCQALWRKTYPTEVFEYDWDNAANSLLPPYESGCAYDLNAAVQRQASFFYHVSLPHYRSKTFLTNASSRYKMFLWLKKVNPLAYLIPCYDIDIMWHTHQLHPIKYRQDCVEILGRMLNHDDTVNDRSSDSRRTRADNSTRKLWKELYGTHFASSGAMYRGISPRHRLHPLNAETSFASALNHGLECVLQTENFTQCIMPEHVEQLWGPIPLPPLPAGQNNDCIAATHRLLNSSGELLFSCRVCHSRPLDMSAVQIFYSDKMIVVSHLIGTEQLPTPDLVGSVLKYT